MASPQDIQPPLTLEGLVTLFRQDVDDLPGDTVTDVNWKNDDTGLLWSNQEIVRYANQAQNEFCFRNPIVDMSVASNLTQLAVTANTRSITYSEKILGVHRAKFLNTTTAEENVVQKRTQQWMDEHYPQWDLLSVDARVGKPEFYVEDVSNRTIHFYPLPEQDGILVMTVGRLPLSSMLWSRRHLDGPEIEAQHHLCLLDYMKYLGFKKRDAETENVNLSAEHLNLFTLHAGERPDARLLRVRRAERNYPRRVRAHYF